MADPILLTPQADWCETRPTGRLRFIGRDGKKILQQEWQAHWGNNVGTSITTEWHDVPLVDPDAP